MIWKQGDRVEWNPTADEWLPGRVVIPGDDRLGIRLDEGEFLRVRASTLRSIQEVTPNP